MLPPWGARRTLEEAEGIDEVKCNAKTQNAKRYFIKTLLFLSCRTGLADMSVTCPPTYTPLPIWGKYDILHIMRILKERSYFHISEACDSTAYASNKER